MKRIDLSGKWIMKNCTKNKEFSAEIPGSNFGALIKSKETENPLTLGDDEVGIAIAEDDFEFKRSFEITEEDLKSQSINFYCSSLDTLATCYINKKEAFKTMNAFIPVDINVKEFLLLGENEIVIHFDSPVKYIKELQKENPLPKNPNGTDGIPYIRKPACHFGWDWGVAVPYSAIDKDVSLICFNKRIENIKISQETEKAKSVITATAENADKISLISPNGEEYEIGKDNTFTVENPELWYTHELSQKDSEPLYTVVFENEEEKIEKKIGLRSLYLSREKDEYGNNFCFILNGEKVFAKGGNLIPFSALYEDSNNETVDYYLDLAQKSNFNIIRVWGGGSFASDYLISECDKRGLLLWQDFCFACQMYPFYDDEFTKNVLKEVKSNVSRLTTHPSLALWCGNNEIETMFSYLPKGTKIMKAYEEFFYHTLPDFIKDLTDVSYIPSSPLGTSAFRECSSDNTGDTHMWNVWHGLKKLDYYATRYSRFLSEFGLESLPSMKAIKTFAKPDEYDITSKSFNRHQKCTGGNKKMLFYLSEMFDFPKYFEDLPYLTGIVQAECIKNATVHFRQNKGRCNGSIFWQFNDVWNCPSWSSVDFEGVPKALQYKAKEFFAPITFTCKKEKRKAIIYLHNDTMNEVKTKLTLILLNPNERKEYDLSVSPNSFKKIDEIKINKNSVLQLRFSNEVITEIFSSPSKLKLKKANITSKLDKNKLTVKSDNFAYNVFIDSDEIAEDNYFSLLKGEERIIEFKNPPKSYKITCANNIEFKKNPIKKKLFRFFYRLKPENIANYFYYSLN